MKNKRWTKYQIMTRLGTIGGILFFIGLGFCIEVFL